jgi:signal transduction histidine kinase
MVQHAIVVRAGTPVPADMQALAGKTILVMAGDVMEELARQHGYGKQLVLVSTQEDALRLLAAGEQDCALVAKVPALYWIAQHRWHNLRVSAQPVLSAESCYAVPHGKEALLSMLGIFHDITERKRMEGALREKQKLASMGTLARGMAHEINNPLMGMTVEDNGPGIPDEIRERVFDPFFTTKDRTRHSGLGLWIARSIVHEHGGDISVESADGNVTRMHVDLPVE